jgi:hypothetical protein
MRKILLLCFCISGRAALIYEIAWFRPLSLILEFSAARRNPQEIFELIEGWRE